MRQCFNEKCGEWFTVRKVRMVSTDSRLKYCSNRCARNQAQRGYRKRIKERNVKQES